MDIFDIKGATVGRGWSPGFFNKLFFGTFATELLEPDHRSRGVSRRELREKLKEGSTAFSELRGKLEEAAASDPAELRARLKQSGAFGMALPAEYGGLDLSHAQSIDIVRRLSEAGHSAAVLELYGSFAVQRILHLFGAPEQKKAYLPRCAAGEPAAPAFEEASPMPDRVETTATLRDYRFRLTGEKLLRAGEAAPKLLAVTARDDAGRGTGVFLLESSWDGVRIEPAGSASGGGARLRLDDVSVPMENLIGEIGQGDHHAQAGLDSAQLLLAACTGSARRCLRAARLRLTDPARGAGAQDDDETSAAALTDIAARLFAMDAVAAFSADLADRGALAHRQETAAALAFHAEMEQEIITETTKLLDANDPVAAEASCDARLRRAGATLGEPPLAALAREATERHLRALGTWVDRERSGKAKYPLLAATVFFYLLWFPLTCIGWSWWPRFRAFGPLAKHMRRTEKYGRKLARAAFYGMIVHGVEFRFRRAFHDRLARIGLHLYAMTAAIVHARSALEQSAEGGRRVDLADIYCRTARRRVQELFRSLWSNDDIRKRRVSRDIRDERYLWLERMG